MFRFEYETYLWALAAVPVLIVFFVLMWRARRQAIARFGDTALVQQLMQGFSAPRYILKFALVILALIFLVVGWANPQWGTKREKAKRMSADVFIALDVSYSMLAEDLPPSRMDRARRFAENLITGLKGDRLGLIAFAGNAYLQMPLTTDYAMAALMTKSSNPFQAPTQGTAIGDAIDLAERAFEEDQKSHKALIIVTDGENHDQAAMKRAEQAARNGLIIFTVGVGTNEATPIPVPVGNRIDYKRDKTGNIVRTSLNEDAMRAIAEAADGAYFNLAQGSDEVIGALQKRIDQLEKKEFEQRIFDEYESYFKLFI
ncbi:MAG: VWA domain-containing protein [Bacteroidota bacterium]